jgi:REP element-mobilizing transposase RayT
METTTAKGWYSRGYQPHFDEPELVQSITFRLHDSVPEAVLERWRLELGLLNPTPSDDPRQVELRKRLDVEDAGYGCCHLGREDTATIMQNALLHFDGTRYKLLAWCVMPNHVHVLSETVPGHPLPGVVHSWKSFTGTAINRVIGTSGTFWMPDYFDRFVRNQKHLESVIDYIENNPVKAGLVADPTEWRYSSAWLRTRNKY